MRFYRSKLIDKHDKHQETGETAMRSGMSHGPSLNMLQPSVSLNAWTQIFRWSLAFYSMDET